LLASSRRKSTVESAAAVPRARAEQTLAVRPTTSAKDAFGDALLVARTAERTGVNLQPRRASGSARIDAHFSGLPPAGGASLRHGGII